MSFEIVEDCVSCWACLPLCPNEAISAAEPHFLIDPLRCTECAAVHAVPQCAAICPVEGAIVDHSGIPLNPPGSLGGLPETMLRQPHDPSEDRHP